MGTKMAKLKFYVDYSILNLLYYVAINDNKNACTYLPIE